MTQSSDGGVTVSGDLSACIGIGNITGGETSAPYTLRFSIPEGFSDRVAFTLNVSSSTQDSYPLNKVFLSYQSNASEDFYGFGAQPSFASLKGQSVPIFSREQGVGRGDEPITTLASLDSFFAGAINSQPIPPFPNTSPPMATSSTSLSNMTPTPTSISHSPTL